MVLERGGKETRNDATGVFPYLHIRDSMQIRPAAVWSAGGNEGRTAGTVLEGRKELPVSSKTNSETTTPPPSPLTFYAG